MVSRLVNQSYLTDGIKVGKSVIFYGYGYVLGPLLFTMYIKSFSDIIRSHYLMPGASCLPLDPGVNGNLAKDNFYSDVPGIIVVAATSVYALAAMGASCNHFRGL